MKPFKIMTLVGTRPEIIRLSRIISKLDSMESVEHILVHTGQNYDYELNQIFFDELELRAPDHYLNAAGSNASETIGNILIKVDPVIDAESPDAFLVLGDTNSCLGALAAKKRKIPIFHLEAGNRCFDQRVPEETNRRIVDHFSDINLTYSGIAREYLISEGIPSDQVIKVGSPMYEVIHHFRSKIDESKILDQLGLVEQEYFLISSHREENVASANFNKLIKILNWLSEKYELPVIVSTHPRTRLEIEKKKVKLNNKILLHKPMGFLDYNKLQLHAKLVLSDSGTISEESSILNIPSLNIRESHERPEAMEEGTVMMSGFNIDRIVQSIDTALCQKRGSERNILAVRDYTVPNVSEKVLRIILSYTDYIKRKLYYE
jgi:UDP-N-acetyl-L-fucosamine synthase